MSARRDDRFNDFIWKKLCIVSKSAKRSNTICALLAPIYWWTTELPMIISSQDEWTKERSKWVINISLMNKVLFMLADRRTKRRWLPNGCKHVFMYFVPSSQCSECSNTLDNASRLHSCYPEVNACIEVGHVRNGLPSRYCIRWAASDFESFKHTIRMLEEQGE